MFSSRVLGWVTVVGCFLFAFCNAVLQKSSLGVPAQATVDLRLLPARWEGTLPYLISSCAQASNNFSSLSPTALQVLTKAWTVAALSTAKSNAPSSIYFHRSEQHHHDPHRFKKFLC